MFQVTYQGADLKEKCTPGQQLTDFAASGGQLQVYKDEGSNQMMSVAFTEVGDGDEAGSQENSTVLQNILEVVSQSKSHLTTR